MKKTILILALTGIIALSAAPQKETVIVTRPERPKILAIYKMESWDEARDLAYQKHREGFVLKSFGPQNPRDSSWGYTVVVEKY